jgi:SAM-dependent methyltransferase
MDSHLFDLNAKLERTHWWYVARAQVIRKLAERLVPPSCKVLEIGCGTGGILAALPAEWERVGVDPSAKAIQLGRSLYPHLDLRLGTAPDAVEEELRAADLVLICDVLEHVEDDAALFGGIVRRLKPFAHLLLTVPAHPELWTQHDVSHGHYRRYTAERLESLWKKEKSLEVSLFSPFNWRLYPIVRLARLATRLTGKSSGQGGSDLFLPPRPINALLRTIFFSEHRALRARIGAPAVKRRAVGVSWMAILMKAGNLPAGGGAQERA